MCLLQYKKVCSDAYSGPPRDGWDLSGKGINRPFYKYQNSATKFKMRMYNIQMRIILNVSFPFDLVQLKNIFHFLF